ncbi:MAG: Maf family nucleotide pyrophosphatase [Muribaculaceae bacterium]|nr:Maf family nucleotide pyrophosphatase [Muribaculaceae bacterium]
MRIAAEPKVLPPLPSEAYRDVRVVLASNSPRRRELLGLIVPAFEIAQSKDVEETYPAILDQHKVPEYLSRLKAEAYRHDIGEEVLLITADTVVILDGTILGKPQSAAEAKEMLRRLSGRTHTVVTGVCLSTINRSESFSASTKVSFAPLAESEIEAYVERFMPLDKAGAYGIQEWVGAAAIEGIEGSFYNVMGLPLHALYLHLRDFFTQE